MNNMVNTEPMKAFPEYWAVNNDKEYQDLQKKIRAVLRTKKRKEKRLKSNEKTA